MSWAGFTTHVHPAASAAPTLAHRFKVVNLRGSDLALWLERLTANAEVATVLGSIPASSSDTVESEGRQMKQC